MRNWWGCHVFFSCTKKCRVLSLLLWKYCFEMKLLINPHKFLYAPVEQHRGHQVLGTGVFPSSPDWGEVAMAYSVKRTACLDKATAKTDDHMLSACYYQTRTEKNKTVWLILNVCLPDRGAGCQLLFSSFFSFPFSYRVRRPVWAPVSLKWGITLWMYWFFFLGYITSTLVCSCAALNSRSRCVVWSIGQKKKWQNTTLAGALHGWGGLRCHLHTQSLFKIHVRRLKGLRGFSWVHSSEITAL